MQDAERVKNKNHSLTIKRDFIARCDFYKKSDREDCDRDLFACSRCIKRDLKNSYVYSNVMNQEYNQMSIARFARYDSDIC